MASENRLWGTERIRGELLKLGIVVSSRSIRREAEFVDYYNHDRPHRSLGAAQAWLGRLGDLAQEPYAEARNPDLAAEIRLELARVPESPSVAILATDYFTVEFRICDNDNKFPFAFDHMLAGSSLRVIRTPLQAPKANADAERWVGGARRECLDWLIIGGRRHLERVLEKYVDYYNTERPHRGLRLHPPNGRAPRSERDGSDHLLVASRGTQVCRAWLLPEYLHSPRRGHSLGFSWAEERSLILAAVFPAALNRAVDRIKRRRWRAIKEAIRKGR